MVPSQTRTILKSQKSTPTVIRDLLQSLFVAELVEPGEEVWIVSPWVSNVAIVDNRGGSFTDIDPSWGRCEIRLADILATLATRGTRVIIVHGPDIHNQHFISDLDKAFCERSVPVVCLRRTQVETLHAKGILSDSFCLEGSMNITYNGIFANDEKVILTNDAKYVAEARLQFRMEYELSEEP